MASVFAVVEIQNLIHSVFIIITDVVYREINQCSCTRQCRFLAINKADNRILTYGIFRRENNLFLKKDGTLAGIDSYEHEDVKGWTDLVAFHENNGLIVGLKKDGTVVASGETKYGACNVSDWTDIVAVKTNYKYTIGKKSDGTFVIATNDTQLEKEFNKVINGK